MAVKRLKRPRDPVQLGKLIGDILTGQVKDEVDDGKNLVKATAGKIGGAVGSRVRAARLSVKQRKQIAQKAARARWAKSKN